jgi:hypothetical protein
LSRRTGDARLALAAAALLGAASARAAAPLPRLEVVLDRHEAWPGEQVAATLRVLSRDPLSGYEVVRAPRLDGFWVEELEVPAALAFEWVEVDGERLRSYLVRRVALFPRRSGRLTVAGAEGDARRRVGAGGFGLVADVRRQRLRAAPVDLVVRALPPGRPAVLAPGAAGTWRLDAEVSPARPRAGDPFTYRLTARGEGNVRALALPTPPPPAGVRALASATRDRTEVKAGRLGGARTVERTLVAERAGTVVIAAVALAYFDPRRGTYEEARAPAVRVEVLPATPTPTPTPTATATATPTATATATTTALTLAGLLALGAVALVALRRRSGRRRSDPESDRARSFALAALDDLRTGRDGSAAALSRALEAWSAARLGRPVAGLTRDALAAALDRAGMAGAPVAAALRLCDAARFGGTADPAALERAAREAAAALERGSRHSR